MAGPGTTQNHRQESNRTVLPFGNEAFVKDIQRRLKEKDTVGKVVSCDSMMVLKEPGSAYAPLFEGKKAALSPENTYYIGSKC